LIFEPGKLLPKCVVAFPCRPQSFLHLQFIPISQAMPRLILLHQIPQLAFAPRPFNNLIAFLINYPRQLPISLHQFPAKLRQLTPIHRRIRIQEFYLGGQSFVPLPIDTTLILHTKQILFERIVLGVHHGHGLSQLQLILFLFAQDVGDAVGLVLQDVQILMHCFLGFCLAFYQGFEDVLLVVCLSGLFPVSVVQLIGEVGSFVLDGVDQGFVGGYLFVYAVTVPLHFGF
jgi:hypothetical protein